jgi:spore maturation protein CgeB
LPAGLMNGTNIIEFSSADEFVRLARYFLEHDRERQTIAQQGRYVAMSRHRSWHRMEEIILGQPVTVCYDNSNNNAETNRDPCPYIIHANETTNTAR